MIRWNPDMEVNQPVHYIDVTLSIYFEGKLHFEWFSSDIECFPDALHSQGVNTKTHYSDYFTMRP